MRGLLVLARLLSEHIQLTMSLLILPKLLSKQTIAALLLLELYPSHAFVVSRCHLLHYSLCKLWATV